MNLLVADHIASGRGFSWDYGGHTVSPIYIQTSGLFLLLAAGAIKVFGISSLALQLANLLFLGLLLVTTSVALRPWRALHIVGPLIVFLGVPAMTIYGLEGYGEVPVAALMLLSFLLLSTAAERPQHALGLCTTAASAVGASLTVKVITIAEIPALVGGVILVAACHLQIPRARLLLGQVFGLVVPIAAFEAYRLQQFGSLHGWATYWSAQLYGAGKEAGGTQAARVNMTNAPRGWPRVHSLGEQLGLDSPIGLLLLLYIPLIALLILFFRRRCEWREWLTRPRHLLAVMLGCVVSLYVPWYVFVSPLDWLRHVLVGLIALVVLYLVTIGIGFSEWRSQTRQRQSVHRTRFLKLGPAYVFIASVTVIVWFLRLAAANVATTTTGLDSAHAANVASTYASGLHNRGIRLCGLGPMSAPVVSLGSRVHFCDLERLSPCQAFTRRSLAEGDVALVFDAKALEHYPDGPTDNATFDYALLAAPSSYASFWRVGLKQGACR